MPIVARFRGISIYMYYEEDAPHQLPHFHVYYGSSEASFMVDPPGLLVGSLPRRQMRYVLAWAELHQAELEANWRRMQNGEVPIRIEGL